MVKSSLAVFDGIVKLIFQIFGALAEFERHLIQERVKAGLEAAKKKGRLGGGRPPALSKADVQAAKAMLKDPDITVKEIAKNLNVSRASLYKRIPGGRSQIE